MMRQTLKFDLPRVSLSTESLQEMERCRLELEERSQQGDLAGVATCYLQLGDLFMDNGSSEVATDLYHRAYSVSKHVH